MTKGIFFAQIWAKAQNRPNFLTPQIRNIIFFLHHVISKPVKIINSQKFDRKSEKIQKSIHFSKMTTYVVIAPNRVNLGVLVV